MGLFCWTVADIIAWSFHKACWALNKWNASLSCSAGVCPTHDALGAAVLLSSSSNFHCSVLHCFLQWAVPAPAARVLQLFLQDGWTSPGWTCHLCTAPLCSQPWSGTFLTLLSLCLHRCCPASAPAARMAFRKPPDGGWGWVIVVVSFFTQFLCYGSPLAVGVLYLEWLDAFGEGKGKTAWVGSLANGIGLLASKCRSSICLQLKCFQLML